MGEADGRMVPARTHADGSRRPDHPGVKEPDRTCIPILQRVDQKGAVIQQQNEGGRRRGKQAACPDGPETAFAPDREQNGRASGKHRPRVQADSQRRCQQDQQMIHEQAGSQEEREFLRRGSILAFG